MRLIDNTLFIGETAHSILNLLCEGKSQIDTALEIGHSRSYVNQITKQLLMFGIIYEIEPRGFIRKYSKVIKDFEISNRRPIIITPKKKGLPHTRRCKNCNTMIYLNKYNQEQKFCNHKCRGEYQRGPKSPAWNGGSTFAPYCWKFNDDLKERVREFFGRKCFVCGETENGITLRIHHIKYNKMACCDGGGDPLMVPLCEKCHNTTTPMKNRELWEKLLYNQLMERTGGKCFFTKEEMINHVS